MLKDSSLSAGHNWELKPVDASQDILVVPNDRAVIIGRQTGSDLMLADQYISRQHATLEVRDGGLFLKDLDSTQGTFVNEERISETQVRHGDEVRFEKYCYTVRQLDFDNVGNDRVQEDAQATVIRKVPEFDVPAVADNNTPSPGNDETNKPATPPLAAESDKPEKQDARSEVPGATPPGKAVASEKPDVSEPADMSKSAVQDKDADQGVSQKADKREWWIPQTEGPKGTMMFKVDPDAAMASAPKVDIVADGPILVALSGKCQGKEFQLDPGKLILGKGDSADLHIGDDTVSDWHAQIIGEGMTWKVVDLISSNGTYVNGKKIRTAFLRPGDVIRMGDVELQYVNSSAGSAAILKKSGSKLTRLGVTVALLAMVVAAGIFALSFYGVI